MKLIAKQMLKKDKQAELFNHLAFALDNGHTYQEILKDIVNAFHCHSQFSFSKYNKPGQGNLIKQGVVYYHKELKLMNALPIINHDINSGVITSSTVEYFVEPVASFTMQDLLNVFYDRTHADTTEYNPKRMSGMFKYMIDRYGLDKLLFMIEAAGRDYQSEKKVFALNDFESYNQTASGYLDEIKNNCKYSGGDSYVIRKRVLFS